MHTSEIEIICSAVKCGAYQINEAAGLMLNAIKWGIMLNSPQNRNQDGKKDGE